MSIEDNTRIVQNIHPFFNERAFDRILSEMIAEDIEWTNIPTAQMFHGLEGMREFMQGWADAFPMPQPRTPPPMLGKSSG